MNTAFTRLFWKEHRAQRMLWYVLVIGWLAIHSLYLFSGTSVLDFMPVIVMIPVCFIVAAAMIAFAGEEDEKTANLLRMLPVPTSSLMSAKVMAIVSGVLMLFLAMAVLSFSLELIVSCVVYAVEMNFGRTAEFLFPFVKPTANAFRWEDGEELYVPAFLALVFAVSVIASMTTRKVFSAVGLSAATIMGIMIAAFMLTSEVRQRQLGVLAPWLAGIAMILVSISTAFLSRPWHLGHLPPHWRLLQFAGDFANGGIPSFAGLWQGWLQRIVARPLTMSRTMSMLTWRECRSAVSFAVIWLTIGIAICVGRYFSNDAYPWPYFFLFVFIHEGGQRTMRDDQRTGLVSLLANIGVHPLQVWISKTFVWICVMFVVGAVVIVVDTIMPTTGMPPSDPGRQMRISDFLHASTVSGRLHLSIWLVAVLGLFSLGQLTACWIRSQIVAFAASIIGVIVSFPVVFQILHWDWPIWISLAPIPFCLLLATAATARRWMDRRVTWSLRICQFALVALPCIVFPMVGQTIWKFQPAFALESLGHESGSAVGSVYNLQNPGNSPEIAQLISMTQTRSEDWHTLDDPAETKCWYEFATALQRFPLHQMAIQQGGYRGDRNAHDREPSLLSKSIYLEKGPEIIQELLQPFDEVLAKTNTFPLPPIAWTAPWSNTPAVALSMLLLEDARHREADGDIPGAVQQIVRAIRINRSLAMQTSSWKNWLACLDAERVALGRLRLLLGTIDLSSTDLDSLQSELTSALVMNLRDGNMEIQWQDPRMMLQRRTLFWGDVLYGGGFIEFTEKLPKNRRGFEVGPYSDYLRSNLRLPEAVDRFRAYKTMVLSEALLTEKFNMMSVYGRVHFQAEPQTERIRQLNRFMQTCSMADLNVDLEILQSADTVNYFTRQQIDTLASERATLLTIMLQKYRIAYGKFPESLLNLSNAGAANNFIRTDPWTGAEFFYAAPNHAMALRLRTVADSPAFTPGQPLLFTPGAIPGRLNTYGPQPTENDQVEMYKLPENVILFLGLSDGIDWRYEQIASKVTVNRDVEIESLTPPRD